MPRILFVTNDSWFFVSHRLAIATDAISEGYDVHVSALQDQTSEKIVQAGCHFHAWNIAPRGRSIIAEVKAFVQLAKLIRKIKPDVVHLITIKPVLYGGILTRILKVPAVVYAVSGLGTVFVGNTGMLPGLRWAIKQLYKYSIRHPNATVIFQNSDDQSTLQQSLSLPNLNTEIIRGSGVDLSLFDVADEPVGRPVVLMPARLLKDKGIVEFVTAAKILSSRGIDVEFQLAGGHVASGNPMALSPEEYDALNTVQNLTLLGNRTDIPQLMQAANLVVLPSYREGLPKALVEAAAAGRAVVTTDVPGCRDAIEPKVTGLLVPVTDAEALADAIEVLLSDNAMRQRFGEAGRKLAEKAFDIRIITQAHLAIYQKLSHA